MGIMKLKYIFISSLAVLFVFPLIGTFAQQAPNGFSIEVITTFDYPGVGNSTLPQKINERGDVVGVFLDSTGVTRGFVRGRNGSFSNPIVEPNDAAGFTEGRGINNSRTLAGDYLVADGTIHSFFRSGSAFTEYDVPGAIETNVLSINELGDFTGGFDPDGSGIFQGFVSRQGTISSIAVPDALSTFAYEVNDVSKVTVGYYVDAAGITHGYDRAYGALTYPIDPPGSVGTILFGLNNENFVVGRYADGAGATHGLVFFPPDTFVTYDYPGATFTSLNGINDKGVICGRYIDASGIAHGFLARAKGRPGSNSGGTSITLVTAPSRVTPLDQSPAAWGNAVPAR